MRRYLPDPAQVEFTPDPDASRAAQDRLDAWLGVVSIRDRITGKEVGVSVQDLDLPEGDGYGAIAQRDADGYRCVDAPELGWSSRDAAIDGLTRYLRREFVREQYGPATQVVN